MKSKELKMEKIIDKLNKNDTGAERILNVSLQNGANFDQIEITKSK